MQNYFDPIEGIENRSIPARIIYALERHDILNTRQIADLVDAGEDAVRRQLRPLLNSGKIAIVDSGKTHTYRKA